MILFPSIFNGLVGIFIISVIAFSLMVFPQVFADNNSSTWKIVIPRGASQQDSPTQTFYPNELPASLGDTIEWVNEDNVAHSITSGVANFPDYFGYFFEAGIVQPGKSVSIKLTNKDYYAFYYLCEIHPWLTGKLFYDSSEAARSETSNPISTNKAQYNKNEKIQVSGAVHKDFWGTDYQILIYDEQKNLVDISYGYFDENSNYSNEISTNSKNWDSSGNYQLKIVYGLPSKVSATTFSFSNDLTQKIIPTWIKNVSSYWCENKISESEFVSAVQYLIKKDIISVNEIQTKQSNEHNVPEWVKTNTCWWSEDKIPDGDFLSGIEFLVTKGTIRV